MVFPAEEVSMIERLQAQGGGVQQKGSLPGDEWFHVMMWFASDDAHIEFAASLSSRAERMRCLMYGKSSSHFNLFVLGCASIG